MKNIDNKTISARKKKNGQRIFVLISLISVLNISIYTVFIPGTSFAQVQYDQPIGPNNTGGEQGNIPSEKEYTLLAPLPCIPTKSLPCPGGLEPQIEQKVTFRTYIQYMINIMIALSAVAAVVMIIWGGLKYMTTTAVSGKTEGLNNVKNAIYGLLLVLCSYIILKTVDPRLVTIPNTLVPKIEIKNLDVTNSSLNFFAQLEKEAAQYRITSKEFGSEIAEARKRVAENELLISEIDQKLSDVFSGTTDATQEEINRLVAEKQRLRNEIIADQTKANNSVAKEALNGVIGDAQSNSMNIQNSPAQAIKRINEVSKKDIMIRRDLYISKLQSRGQYDVSEINAFANYADARLDLLIAERMVAGAQKISSGYGQLVRTEYQIISPDGNSNKLFSTTAAAQAYIQKQIDKAQNVSANLSPDLATELKNSIETTKATLANISYK